MKATKAIVTGHSRGLGAAIAGELLERHPAADGRCAQYAGDGAGEEGQQAADGLDQAGEEALL